jgi:hypothetical protein
LEIQGLELPQDRHGFKPSVCTSLRFFVTGELADWADVIDWQPLVLKLKSIRQTRRMSLSQLVSTKVMINSTEPRDNPETRTSTEPQKHGPSE